MNELTPTATEGTPVPTPADAAKMAELRQKVEEYRRWRSCAVLCGVVCLIVWALPGREEIGYSTALRWIFLFPFGVLVGLTFAFGLRLRNRGRKAIKELTKRGGVGILGLLLDHFDVTKSLNLIEPALITLLRQVKATDAPLFSPQHHRILSDIIDYRKFVVSMPKRELFFAILKAYEQIGNKEDLPVVVRLAAGRGYACYYSGLQSAASACIPYLYASAEKHELRKTLLRASSQTEDNGTNLLRPAAHGTSTTEPRQLLRPAGPDGANETK